MASLSRRIYASFCSRHPSPTTNMSNWIECYNPSNNAWHHVSRVPGLIENHILKGFSMAVMGGSIFVIGGRLCHKMEVGDNDNPNDIVEVDLEVLSSVLRYDIGDDAWFKCAPLGTPRFDFACTVCEDKIYVAGGQCALASAKGVSSAEVYDLGRDMWEALPNMSTLRYKCVGVTWQGKVHVVGGFAARGDSWDTMERSSAELYDPDGSRWKVIVAWKGHIEAYDEELNIWKVVEGSTTISFPISTPTNRRLYLTMAPIGTDLYFLAGYRMPAPAGEISRMKSVVHVFNTTSNGDKYWRSFKPIEEEEEKELCSHGCVAC
ncbi:F-box/kelch-repeat protein At1g16250-like [Alnus glutinosa]|uniref:F-box/kelch-repeat protein At1g16250-like n=1 Tax=Alnus glutinosa TaxID=3517 RepID=UPI002D76D273|nr:F-box/kelch-repeat protein At1g16250-like [Alnus glutinosa]